MSFVIRHSNRHSLLLLLTAVCIPEGIAAPADLVVRGANVLTMHDAAPRASALAVAGGRFVAVGDADVVAPLIGPQTRVLSLDGKTVVPGFIDAHAHPRAIYPADSRWAAVDCSPAAVPTIDELVAALRRKAERTPAGQWVTGSRYQETKLGRHPTRQDLDRASTNHPILISHSSGHQSVGNSLALRLAKVTRATVDPPGGRFVRDEAGEPTGLLQERAAGVVRSAGPASVDPPEEETIAAYREGLREFLRRGITSVHVAGTSLRAARLLERATGEDLPIRLYIMLREGEKEEAVQRKDDSGVKDTDILRFGAIKLFHGNSLSGQTCWLSKPYANRPDYFGVPPARSQEALDELIFSLHDAGLQACVHSNGDREIDMLVTAFERALARRPRPDHRHRIEHGSVMTAALLQRIQRIGVIVVPHAYIWEHGDKMEAYGAERWEWMHAARAMLDLGIRVAGHSDSPVSKADALLRIHDMVTRTSAEGKVYGAGQRITATEALRIWTIGGAYASFAESRQGSIAVGKLADFAVLGADPIQVKPDAIKDISIDMTVVGGKIVHQLTKQNE